MWCLLPPHTSQNFRTKQKYYLCIQTPLNPKLFHMSPPYLPICGIYLPFQVNLYVPNFKPSKEILFCMLKQLMFQLGLPISSMLCGLFSRGVDSTPHSRERAGNRDAQSHDPKSSKQIKIIKQNSPGTVVGMDGTRCFRQAVEFDCWWRGSKPLLLSLGNRHQRAQHGRY